MKKLFYILIPAAFCVAVVSSCSKNAPEVAPQEVLMSFDVDAPAVDMSPATKIIHNLDPENDNVHIITWKAGDQFSLMGYVYDVGQYNTGGATKYDLVNFSANRFTLRYGDGTKSFIGYFPDFKEMYPAVEGGGKTATQNRTTLHLMGVYPAVTFTCDTPDNGVLDKRFNPASPMSIEPTQDGTGWPYAYFVTSRLKDTSGSADPQYDSSIGHPRIDSYYMTPNGIRFRLGCCIARLKLKANKNITSITVKKTEDEWQGFVGPVTAMSLAFGGFTITGGCRTQELTINNGGNLVEADDAEYADIYFACRGLFSGKHYTITFTAADGTTHTSQLNPSQTYGVGVWNLGAVTVNTWE